MRIIDNADVAEVGNDIPGNVAQATGGGIDVDCCDGNTPLISQNLVVGNQAGAGGGGIRVSSTNARLVNNVVSANEADGRDGILLDGWKSYPVSARPVHNVLAGQGNGDEGIHAGAWADADLVNNTIATIAIGIANKAPAGSMVTMDHTLLDGDGLDCGEGVASAHEAPGRAALVSPEMAGYHTAAQSLTIDAGLNVEGRLDVDSDRHSGVPDIGAGESYPPRMVYLPLLGSAADRAGQPDQSAWRPVCRYGRLRRQRASDRPIPEMG